MDGDACQGADILVEARTLVRSALGQGFGCPFTQSRRISPTFVAEDTPGRVAEDDVLRRQKLLEAESRRVRATIAEASCMRRCLRPSSIEPVTVVQYCAQVSRITKRDSQVGQVHNAESRGLVPAVHAVDGFVQLGATTFILHLFSTARNAQAVD